MPWLMIPKYNKYGNKKTQVGDRLFASKKEARRYQELLLLAEHGEIRDLRLQVPFKMVVGGIKICTYIADFVYHDQTGGVVVEDSKGYETREFKLKAKLFRALFPNYKLLIT
jgi:hypothetical protein